MLGKAQSSGHGFFPAISTGKDPPLLKLKPHPPSIFPEGGKRPP
jgi:hypothetical protein